MEAFPLDLWRENHRLGPIILHVDLELAVDLDLQPFTALSAVCIDRDAEIFVP